jgi:hypothetical protein
VTDVTPSASVAGTAVAARRTMTGQVTRVDPAAGTFTLKTADGTLDLHAPPAALANVKPGDTMTVDVSIRPIP